MKALKQLLSPLDILEEKNPDDVPIQKIAYHSENVIEDTLFVCIRGLLTDGHAFARHAVQKGAVALIVEEFIEDVNVPQYKVKNTRIALARTADLFFGHPSKKMTIVGITASNGKTSTSFLLRSIFQEAGFNTGLIGTVMVQYGNTVIPSTLTTPESLDLQEHLFNMHKQGVTHVIMEVSSSALDLHRVAYVDFYLVSFNNISPEHLDVHGSFEEYFNVKSTLIRQAKSNSWAILNLDDEHSASLINETKAQVFTYGIQNKTGNLFCEKVDLTTGRAIFTVHLNHPVWTENKEKTPPPFPLKLSIAGYHSVYNSLPVIAMSLLCGISIKEIQKGIHAFKGIERRFQIIFDQGFIIIDDHFANVGNIDVTLDTLTQMTYNQLHLVYAIRGNRGVETNKKNAEALVKWLPKLGVTKIIATLSQESIAEKDKVSKKEKTFLKR